MIWECAHEVVTQRDQPWKPVNKHLEDVKKKKKNIVYAAAATVK